MCYQLRFSHNDDTRPFYQRKIDSVQCSFRLFRPIWTIGLSWRKKTLCVFKCSSHPAFGHVPPTSSVLSHPHNLIIYNPFEYCPSMPFSSSKWLLSKDLPRHNELFLAPVSVLHAQSILTSLFLLPTQMCIPLWSRVKSVEPFKLDPPPYLCLSIPFFIITQRQGPSDGGRRRSYFYIQFV